MNCKAVKRKNEKKLLQLKNVVGVGIGVKNGDFCICVNVTKKVHESQLERKDIVPKKISGIETDVIETGRIVITQRTDLFRPAPGGVSIGHIDITAGTLGCLVERTGIRYILSNNHVLANSNDALIGDSILQPGVYDGGAGEDRIGALEDFVPINFGGGTLPPDCNVSKFIELLLNLLGGLLGSRHRFSSYREIDGVNRVDAAIALPDDPEDVIPEILEIGVPSGVNEDLRVGDFVKKSGRTTGLTTGTVLQEDVTVNVSYGTGKVALFEGQFMSGAMSAGGDSGSVVLDGNNSVVGLLFAGSDTTTIFNPIADVIDALGVTVVTKAFLV